MLKRVNLEQDTEQKRTIKSYVAREGRTNIGQSQVLAQLWEIYGVELQGRAELNFSEIFANSAPVVLEIGFGDGRSLHEMAQREPRLNFLGVEVYKTGIAKLCSRLRAAPLPNLKLMCVDAAQLLEFCIPDGSLYRLQLFFPDPWPKVRHHKRRIVSEDFLQLVHKKLAVNGVLHIATDWQNYAEAILAQAQNTELFHNLAGYDNFANRPLYRPLTKFEERGIKLGHKVFDLVFKKVS